MIDIYQLKNLSAFAQCGTLTATAEVLNTSQPSLTRSMASLEYEMGAPLFDRTKNRITLNDNGLLALGYANRILAQVEEMRSTVIANDRAKRTISIGSCAAGPTWVIQSKPGAEFEGRNIEFEIVGEPELFKGIETGKYEWIILPYSAERSAHGEQFSSKKICEENLCFSLPKDHPLAKRESLSFSDLNGENFIVAHNLGFWNKVQDLLPDSKFLMQTDKFTFEEISRNSALPHFVTDLSVTFFNRPVENKAVIPISAPEAHAEFFLWARK